ncbi:MAG: cobyrinate a,c-diamide synthase, partial [Desulfatiglandales bacterium]
AQLSKLLRAPVCLIVDVTMATRTVAALVKGCQVFDPEVDLRAVIINKVATTRQESLIKKAIEEACGIPVVGAIPRKSENPFPERHMGLLPYQENEEAFKAVEWARRLVGEHVDVEILREIAYSAPPLEINKGGLKPSLVANSVKIGVLLDKAFWFYYPENLELLRSLGAQLVYLDSLRDREVKDIDGIYVGGGFPETQAEALAKNEGFRKRLGQMIQNGLPVYAECGGLIYLGKEVHFKGNSYPMLDIFPIRFEFQSRPAGHGYTEFVAERPNPYYEMNRPIKGHEFHYSIPRLLDENASEFVFRILRGNGFDGKRDGIMKGAVLGTYMHVHALGEKQWAEGLVELSRLFSLKAIGKLAP